MEVIGAIHLYWNSEPKSISTSNIKKNQWYRIIFPFNWLSWIEQSRWILQCDDGQLTLVYLQWIWHHKCVIFVGHLIQTFDLNIFFIFFAPISRQQEKFVFNWQMFNSGICQPPNFVLQFNQEKSWPSRCSILLTPC